MWAAAFRPAREQHQRVVYWERVLPSLRLPAEEGEEAANGGPGRQSSRPEGLGNGR